jgi:hypothetical protein
MTRCPGCSMELHTPAKYCTECGCALDTPPEGKSSPSKGRPGPDPQDRRSRSPDTRRYYGEAPAACDTRSSPATPFSRSSSVVDVLSIPTPDTYKSPRTLAGFALFSEVTSLDPSNPQQPIQARKSAGVERPPMSEVVREDAPVESPPEGMETASESFEETASEQARSTSDAPREAGWVGAHAASGSMASNGLGRYFFYPEQVFPYDVSPVPVPAEGPPAPSKKLPFAIRATIVILPLLIVLIILLVWAARRPPELRSEIQVPPAGGQVLKVLCTDCPEDTSMSIESVGAASVPFVAGAASVTLQSLLPAGETVLLVLLQTANGDVRGPIAVPVSVPIETAPDPSGLGRGAPAPPATTEESR